MAINPNEYMINLKGKAYLPVAPRIVMLREAHPDWTVLTELVAWGDVTLVKATVLDDGGRVVSQAHKTVTRFAGGDVEKAETGAIGRALSIAGFGTIQAGDMDEGEQIADAPVTKNGNGQAPRPRPQAEPAAPTSDESAAPESDAIADARTWLEGETATLRAVAAAAVMTGRYGHENHAYNALKSNPDIVEHGVEVKAAQAVKPASALRLFDWLMARKAEEAEDAETE